MRNETLSIFRNTSVQLRYLHFQIWPTTAAAGSIKKEVRGFKTQESTNLFLKNKDIVYWIQRIKGIMNNNDRENKRTGTSPKCKGQDGVWEGKSDGIQ